MCRECGYVECSHTYCTRPGAVIGANLSSEAMRARVEKEKARKEEELKREQEERENAIKELQKWVISKIEESIEEEEDEEESIEEEEDEEEDFEEEEE